MFGDDLCSDEKGRIVRVCCGPRCGAEASHRRIYSAVEDTAKSKDLGTVLPAMCQGMCGSGVTLVLPDGNIIKVRAPSEARDIVTIGEK